MGGKILGYLDCASPYSYFAIKYLREQRKLLKQYDIEIEFVPFFLGGVNVATGNKPPTSLPARAAHSSYDMKRARAHFNTVKLTGPPFFPMLSLLPQRCMIAIKDNAAAMAPQTGDYDSPEQFFETVYERCWIYCFHLHKDLSQPEMMRELLREFLSERDTDEIFRLAGTKDVKDKLTANTKEALEKGAFGAPWWWLTNDQGQSEPMFGSDRFSYMFKFLGVDVQELAIIDKEKMSTAAKL